MFSEATCETEDVVTYIQMLMGMPGYLHSI